MRLLSHSGFKKDQTNRGFTLVELLVVVALIGVLASAILVVINPIEQFNRAKDSKLEDQVNTYAKALAAYKVSNGVFPPVDATWVTKLTTDASIMKAAPSTIGISVSSGFCPVPAMKDTNGEFCYKLSGTDVAIYSVIQAKANMSGCAQTMYYSWHSTTEKVGSECLGAEPTP